MEVREFLIYAQLDAGALDSWVAAGWLAPRRENETLQFSDIDIARALLVHDLRRLGVNDDGIPVILDLVDQVHGLRRMLRELLAAIQGQPEAMKRWIIADLHGRANDRPGDAGDRASPRSPGRNQAR
jgi:chaperone modulatory protein CbpM